MIIARRRQLRSDHKSQITNHTSAKRSRRQKIKALFFDVDGVLTDGHIYLSGNGRELKVFDTKDGHGIRKAVAAGLRIAWISGRTSDATAARARELGVHVCLQGIREKEPKFEALLRRWNLDSSETAAIGDDEPDVPLLLAAGFSACPADATPAAQGAAQVVLQRNGGSGAAREFIELVLRLNERGSARPKKRSRRSKINL